MSPGEQHSEQRNESQVSEVGNASNIHRRSREGKKENQESHVLEAKQQDTNKKQNSVFYGGGRCGL